MENTNAPPTGCFKCGRPGHWSRDCPSSSAPPNSNFSSHKTNAATGSGSTSGGGNFPKTVQAEKPKKVPRRRPKLTPDLFLSDDGLGFVLRHFPRAFKYRGRGHEVSDLGKLIGLYSEWHSHLLPYYSFDQFIYKVEQVAATRRVKFCIRDLRERVASGGDPTKLYESRVEHEHDDPTNEQAAEAMNLKEQLHDQADPSNVHVADDSHEDLLHEIYNKATELQEPSLTVQNDVVADDVFSAGSAGKGSLNQEPNNGGNCSNEVEISEEQRARMEANRLKALERAVARTQQLQES